MATAQNMVIETLKSVSGNSVVRNNNFFIFNKIIGFKGIVDGVGCSTLVAEIAVNLAKVGLNVCVIDTSFLAPAQFTLLDVNLENEEQKDWFDLGRAETTANILKISKINSNIAVLGLRNRNINDLISNYDTEEMVTVAYNILEDMYDVVLVDICSETTNITTAAAIHSHTIFQVWTDEYLVMNNLDNFLKNMIYRCCHVDKMKNVIINKMSITSQSEWSSVLKKYNFSCIGELPFSVAFYTNHCLGLLLSKMTTVDKQVEKINSEMVRICDFILGKGFIDGKLKAKDIMDGKVEGTARKKMKEYTDLVSEVLGEDAVKIEKEYGIPNHYTSNEVVENKPIIKEKPKKKGLFGGKDRV